jgi:hypothetical protein
LDVLQTAFPLLSEYSNFRRSSSGFILVIKVLSAKLISAAISAFDSLVYSPHLKKLPIDCQHTCSEKTSTM